MKFYLMFVAAMLIFGSNGVFASMLEMSGAQLVLLRTLIGGAVLLIIILISRSRTPKEVLLREKWRLLFAGVCLGANWALLFEAYNLMNVSLATLTYYTAPVLVLVLGCAVLAFGISVEVAPRVLMVPGEGIVQAIAVVTGRQFGNVKTAFDATLVSTALLLSLLFFHRLQGLGIGTIFSALAVGRFVNLYNRRLPLISRISALGART